MLLNIKKHKYKTVNDLAEIQFDNNMEEIRKKYKILVIDDEGFAQKDGLIKLGYKDIDVKYEYNNMEELKAYDIIFCDINGVAREIDSYYQGAALAKKIKEMYPEKYVIIFSALDKSLDFYDYYKSVDDVIVKNLNSNQFSGKLDEYIKKISSIRYRWNSIKKILEKNNVPLDKIAEIEKCYVKSIEKNKSFSVEFKKYCNKNSDNYSEVLKKIAPYVIDIAKDVVISVATK